MAEFQPVIDFIKSLYPGRDFIGLHEPVFSGKEKEYVLDCIDSTFVSSVGKYVDRFELEFAGYTGTKHAVAVVNGTQALFVALQLAGVTRDTEVITQSATFVATANAIAYTGAVPAFVDIDPSTLGMNPSSLDEFLCSRCHRSGGVVVNKLTGRRISAVVPMHTFGNPCDIASIVRVCADWSIPLVEDAAESLGSKVGSQHTGTFGLLGAFSFNGNKTITTGGGGMIVTDNESLAREAKHLTTTAKVPHPHEFIHDRIGYNFRMPNLNAALGVAQLEMLPVLLEKQKILASKYAGYFSGTSIQFVSEPQGCTSNHWMNAILLRSQSERDAFLAATNQQKVQTRALWRPSHMLEMYSSSPRSELSVTENVYERLVNIPSTVVLNPA